MSANTNMFKAGLLEAGIEQDLADKALKYLLLDPRDEKRWGGVAVDFKSAGKFYAAELTFQTALQQFPLSALMLHSRGLLLTEWDKFDGAEYSFQRALEIDPNFFGSLLGLGLLYERFERYNQVVSSYLKFLSHRPDNAKAYNNLANCYRALDSRDLAAKNYELSLAKDPAHVNALFSYAAFLYENLQFDRALKCIDRCLSLKPDDDEAQHLRDEIRKRPSTPQRIGRAIFREQKFVARGSVTSGWAGPAAKKPRLAQIQPDFSRQGTIGPDELVGMTLNEIRSSCGFVAADIIQLNRLVREYVAQNPPHSKPRIFLSYRHNNKKWVKALAVDLRSRGYEVVFDSFLNENQPDLTVTEIVSHIASCNVFLPILTNDYARSAEPNGMFTETIVPIGIDENSWVFDEARIARQLMDMGRMSYFGLWRSGFMMPSPFSPENVVDVRQNELYSPMLDRYFPSLS